MIADAKPADADLVRSYGADIVVERGPALPSHPPGGAGGVDALLDTALWRKSPSAAIRDDGVYIPVRGWADKPSERGIKIKPVFVSEVLRRGPNGSNCSATWSRPAIKLRVAGEYAPDERRRCAACARGRWPLGPTVSFSNPATMRAHDRRHCRDFNGTEPRGLRRLRLHGAAGEDAEHQGDAFLELGHF